MCDIKNDKRAEIWNERLKNMLKLRRLSQTEFADELNKKNNYKTQYSQKSVSRWINVGSLSNNKKIGFPQYETMRNIADFFDVDVGYLLGETDFDTFDAERTAQYLGLDENSIRNIRELINPDLDSFPHCKSRIAMNILLGSFEFKELFLHILDLYNCSPVSGIPDHNKFDCEEEAMGYAQDVNESISLNRYKVYEAFFHLLDELYPYSCTKDFILPDENVDN